VIWASGKESIPKALRGSVARPLTEGPSAPSPDFRFPSSNNNMTTEYKNTLTQTELSERSWRFSQLCVEA